MPMYREGAIYLLDPDYFDNQKFWDEVRILDEKQGSRYIEKIKNEFATLKCVSRIGIIPMKRFEERMITFFPIELTICVLMVLMPEHAKDMMLKCCRPTLMDDPLTDFDNYQQFACHESVSSGLERKKARVYKDDTSCFFVGQNPIVVQPLPQKPQKKTPSFRLSHPSFMLSCLLATAGISAVIVAFAVLNAATFGTAGVCVATVGVGAVLVSVGLFYRACSAKPSNRNEWVLLHGY